MRHLNIIGAKVAKLRFERKWTQEILAARLQCQGTDISREVLANIESGRTQVTDEHIMAFQNVFGVRIILLFPKPVQERDEKFAQQENAMSMNMPRRSSR
jgi:transcriptional regulator with XRE-family HTH domain